MLRFESRHGLWKSVTQSLDHLEQREIDVSSLLAENEGGAFGRSREEVWGLAQLLRPCRIQLRAAPINNFFRVRVACTKAQVLFKVSNGCTVMPKVHVTKP